jgi:GH15 family glucan-1,4-alpha-glucosidase
LIWRSRWVTTTGTVECRDALALPGDPDRLVLLRRIEAVDGPAVIDVHLNLAADFGRTGPAELHRTDEGDWLIRTGDLRCRWSGASEAVVAEDGTLHGRIRVDADTPSYDLVLQIGRHEPVQHVDPHGAWARTAGAWHSLVPTFPASAAPRDSQQAYAVLRGLTAPGGGMVAAPTLGLPERAEAGRNYDYRYVWLRDQAYAGLAVAVDQPLPLLQDALAFTTACVLEHGDQIAPAYTIDRRPLPHESTLNLSGYPGGHDVVGNWVTDQFQLDACGEMLQLYAAGARHGGLEADDEQAIAVLAELVSTRWTQPDAGIWELHDAWWAHSRLACVAGLRAVAEHHGLTDTAAATGLADAILAETSRRCLGADGAWRQSPDHARVDAALLLPPSRGALDAQDPRSLSTLGAVRRDLVEDGYVYRYRPDDRALGQAEGAFLMCGFAMALAELDAGHVTEAFRSFERQRAACGPPGLFAEEFDVQQRQLRGNLPQAFVHALLLETSQRLGSVAT